MDELKTLLGTDIPIIARGVLYICYYDPYVPSLTVIREIFCSSPYDALELYANIPNPESQVASGNTFDEFIGELHKLHKNMKCKKWLRELGDFL